MKAEKIIKRIPKARFVQLFVVDDEGVGYFSGSFKDGFTNLEAEKLIERMKKEIEYLEELIEKHESPQFGS